MTYTIRPVRPTDLAAVTEVEAICFPAAEAAAEESFKARIAAFPECFFVAEADGKITVSYTHLTSNYALSMILTRRAVLSMMPQYYLWEIKKKLKICSYSEENME